MSIEAIDRHSTADAFSTHDPGYLRRRAQNFPFLILLSHECGSRPPTGSLWFSGISEKLLKVLNVGLLEDSHVK